MPLISRIFTLFVLFAACAGAMDVQVIEGENRGPRDLSSKKLMAMAKVYLAELGHVPSLNIQNAGVSFSSAGPVMHLIRMQKFSADGKVETDSVVVAEVDDVDDAVETMLTKSFGYTSKTYKGEKPSEVFFMDSELIDVDERMADIATKRTELALEQLGFRLAENNHEHGVKVRMFLVKLKSAYWLGMMRMEGSKVIRGVHKKFMPSEKLEPIIHALTSEVMNPEEMPKDSNTKVVDYADTHEAKCRATASASSISGFFAGLTFDILCYLSDYVGLEIATGGKDLYGNWYPNLRFNYVWGFSDYHAWLLGLDYAGTMGKTQSRWAFESIHRFSQRKGVFIDFVWGWGRDRKYKGWYMGGDIGYNLFASSSKAHWLSLMLRYDWTLDESFSDGSRISVNLIYDLRGYFSD